jgi:membrane fusion protein, copper/silver efflux system
MKSKLTLAISLLAFACATPALIAEEHPQGAATKEAHKDHMFEGYSVATALYKDDLAAAKKAAAGMVKHDKDGAMAMHCQAIADSKTIEEARTHFKMLSDAAIPVAKKEKMMHEMHCPMAFDNKGANWLQKSADEVQNPYFGAKMPHCGKMVMAK